MSEQPAKRRPGHLMDPDVLEERYRARVRAEHAAHAAGRTLSTSGETVYVTDRPQRRGGMPVERVRQFVVSALIGVTLFHFTVGLAIAGVLSHQQFARVGLSAMALFSGTFAVVAARLVHQKPVLSPWLLLGASVGGVALVVVMCT